jgi:alkanesulfonate monooxygenase SsuD/methylene tetrahydromethanopterin reductase-like flavin-dependent oxidoreductase (luciferase family)
MTANRDVALHYGFADPSNFAGVKGYEAYAARAGAATAVIAAAAGDPGSQPKTPGYHASNLMIGTPDEVIRRITAAQKACSFSEITIVPHFGTLPYDQARRSTELFAREVLPVIQKMEAPLHAAALPADAVA